MGLFVPRLPQLSGRDDWQLRSVSLSRHPGQLALRLSPTLRLTSPWRVCRLAGWPERAALA